MARVEIKTPRDQSSSFGLYRTSAGGDESIIVRRKVGEPTDVNHTKSRKLALQRYELTLASQHYAQLTPSQKAITTHQIEEVEFQKSHGKTDTKLLSGRQLFISKEMHSLATTQTQLVLPYELCIMLVDESLLELEGELWLRYLKDAEWKEATKEELYTGSWLFSQTPKAQEAYRPYGEAINYYDPELPEHQNMTEAQLLTYHYHILLSGLTQYCHSLPTNINGVLTGAGNRLSQPFMPCTPFELKEIRFTLRRMDDPEYPPCSSGFIALHNVTEGRKPIEPPLRTANFDVSVPAYPEWGTHKATFEPILLEADTMYAWVLCFGAYPPNKARIHAEEGQAGVCNLDPITPTFISYWQYGSWQDWKLFSLPQFNYEMKGTPP